jgi:hypothetical protein
MGRSRRVHRRILRGGGAVRDAVCSMPGRVRRGAGPRVHSMSNDNSDARARASVHSVPAGRGSRARRTRNLNVVSWERSWQAVPAVRRHRHGKRGRLPRDLVSVRGSRMLIQPRQHARRCRRASGHLPAHRPARWFRGDANRRRRGGPGRLRPDRPADHGGASTHLAVPAVALLQALHPGLQRTNVSCNPCSRGRLNGLHGGSVLRRLRALFAPLPQGGRELRMHIGRAGRAALRMIWLTRSHGPGE